MHTTATRGWLQYVTPSALRRTLDENAGHVLGIVGFGAQPPRTDIPCICIDMPTPGAPDGMFEVWTAAGAVNTETRDGLQVALNADTLFVCIDAAASGPETFEQKTIDAYRRLFAAIDALGYPHLLRIWHYLPDIHLDEQCLERYKRFSLGRHEAFIAAGRNIPADAPAASAVGKRTPGMAMVALAGRAPGTPVENPRQVSAYSYPQRYGPRGPTFSRALSVNLQGTRWLLISGTASIVGHRSLHPGDVAAQADETIRNLRALIAEAQSRDLAGASAGTGLLLKVYLRQTDSRPVVEAKLRAAFPGAAAVVWLQADICREELLLEIEAVCAA
jgi:chorismate lyase / 3-hydroxybenzoate synthase